MKKIIILLSALLINTSSKMNIFCDIKGNIKKPGVYPIKENYTIQDVINEAGGLTKNAYTDNINLSKKVTDEMVIYIFDKDTIKKLKELNKCVCNPIYKYKECDIKPEDTLNKEIEEDVIETTTKTISTKPIIKTTTTTTTTTISKNNKININTCKKEELLILDGLGEKKANAIIEYRENVSKFNSIEEIMKVNGIGQTTFDKIKEFIEV